MENIWRWMLVAAIAPVAWGSTYLVTAELLPPETPLWGAVLRALPAGLLLLALPVARGARRLPTGPWWWRSPTWGSRTGSAAWSSRAATSPATWAASPDSTADGWS